MPVSRTHRTPFSAAIPWTSLAVCFAMALAGCPRSDAGMTLKRLDPDFGPLQGGQTVRIKGSGLRLDIGYSVYFGTRPGSRVSFRDDRTLLVVTPQSSVTGPVDVIIRADNGASFKLAAGFTYQDQGGNLLQDIGKSP